MLGAGSMRDVSLQLLHHGGNLQVVVPISRDVVRFVDEHLRADQLSLGLDLRAGARWRDESDGQAAEWTEGDAFSQATVMVARSDWVTNVVAPLGVDQFVLMELPVPPPPERERWGRSLQHLAEAEEFYHEGNDAEVLQRCYAAFEALQGASKARKWHPEPCEHWGPQPFFDARTWEDWVERQVRKIRHDPATIERIVRVLSTPEAKPADTTRARIERRKRELAMDHAEGRIDDDTYLARMAALRAEAESARPSGEAIVDPAESVRLLKNVADLWGRATPQERAELVGSIYDTITIRGAQEFVEATLTPAAYASGLALALPETLTSSELARPPVLSRWE